jgi:hypothetical protein
MAGAQASALWLDKRSRRSCQVRVSHGMTRY